MRIVTTLLLAAGAVTPYAEAGSLSMSMSTDSSPTDSSTYTATESFWPDGTYLPGVIDTSDDGSAEASASASASAAYYCADGSIATPVLAAQPGAAPRPGTIAVGTGSANPLPDPVGNSLTVVPGAAPNAQQIATQNTANFIASVYRNGLNFGQVTYTATVVGGRITALRVQANLVRLVSGPGGTRVVPAGAIDVTGQVTDDPAGGGARTWTGPPIP